MSWSLSRPNVSLRVTKFAPETHRAIHEKAVRSRVMQDLIDRHKQRRAKEQTKVAPALELDPEKYMCTCHGFERAGEYCIEFCGKERE